MRREQFGLYYTFSPNIPDTKFGNSQRVSLAKDIKSLDESLHELVFMFIIEHAIKHNEWSYPSETLPYSIRRSSKDDCIVRMKLRNLPNELLWILSKFIAQRK